jgi:hypothetical protein
VQAADQMLGRVLHEGAAASAGGEARSRFDWPLSWTSRTAYNWNRNQVQAAGEFVSRAHIKLLA